MRCADRRCACCVAHADAARPCTSHEFALRPPTLFIMTSSQVFVQPVYLTSGGHLTLTDVIALPVQARDLPIAHLHYSPAAAVLAASRAHRTGQSRELPYSFP